MLLFLSSCFWSAIGVPIAIGEKWSPKDNVSAAAFDMDVNNQLLQMSELAYCLPCLANLSASPPVHSCKPSQTPAFGSKFNVDTILYDHHTDTHGYIGVSDTYQRIILSFRGTEDPYVALAYRGWGAPRGTPWGALHAGRSALMTAKRWNIGEEVQVHEGFLGCYLTLSAVIVPIIQRLRGTHPGYHFYITGHSLGASLATIAAVDMAWVNHIPVAAVYNYGSPRTGLQSFVDFMNEYPIADVFRLTHHQDPVPRLPQEFVLYRHIPQEIFQPAKVWDGKLIQCDGTGEDPKCIDQYDLSIEISDHLNYQGVTMGIYGC